MARYVQHSEGQNHSSQTQELVQDDPHLQEVQEGEPDVQEEEQSDLEEHVCLDNQDADVRSDREADDVRVFVNLGHDVPSAGNDAENLSDDINSNHENVEIGEVIRPNLAPEPFDVSNFL